MQAALKAGMKHRRASTAKIQSRESQDDHGSQWRNAMVFCPAT